MRGEWSRIEPPAGAAGLRGGTDEVAPHFRRGHWTLPGLSERLRHRDTCLHNPSVEDASHLKLSYTLYLCAKTKAGNILVIC